jgi:hypothetical protein
MDPLQPQGQPMQVQAPDPDAELRRLLGGLGGYDAQSEQLQQQMARAQALRQGTGQHHSTGIGAALGGLGDVVRAYQGGQMGLDAQAKVQALQGNRDKARSTYDTTVNQALAFQPDAAATPEEQQKARVAALLRQEQIGMMGQGSPDPVVQGQGKATLERVSQQRLFDQQREMERLRQASEKEQKDAAERAGKDKATRDAAEGLRKELMGNPVTRATQELASAYGKLQPSFAKPSAAGDLNIVFGIMKMYDPGSSVRESEQATARNAAGVPDKVRSMWNALISGQNLSPAARADFQQQADSLYAAQLDRYEPLAGQYAAIADKYGVPRDEVALDLGFKRPQPKAGSQVIETRQLPDGRIIEKLQDGTKRVRK